MLIGPYVNGSAVIIGGLIGAMAGGKLPERVKTALPMTFGLCSVGLGITLVLKVKYMPAVVLAMVLGAFLGELLHLEKRIGSAAGSTRGLINKVLPPVQGLGHEEFTEKFVAILVLFCASGTGIFGAMTEGMSGDPSILYIKTILDLFTAGIFATLLGYAVMTIAIPQIVIQVALAMLAGMYLHRWRDGNSPEDEETGVLLPADCRERPLGGNPFAGASAVFRSPFLMGIGLFIILLAGTNTFLYFELMSVVASSFPDPVRQTQVFGALDVVVQGCTMLLQVFLAGRIVRKFGLAALLAAVPVLISLGFVWMAFAPVFAVVAVVMAVRRIGEYGMVRPGREMLNSVLSPEEKYKAKSFIDTVLYRGGDAVSAWLKSSFNVLGAHSPWAMLAGAAISFLWAATGFLLAGRFRKMAGVQGKK